MINHGDRIPTQPGRRQIVPEDGSPSFFATVSFADNPTNEGALVNKAMLDEFLSASGVTTGTAAALVLAQTGFTLADGAPIRFKLHIDTNGGTLNVQNTGAKPLCAVSRSGVASFTGKAGMWIQVIYSQTLDAYCLPFEEKPNETSYPTFAGLTLLGTLNMSNQYIDGALFR